jgi:two-component system, cell cycle sensor histidine kinase and response regulator CckA
LHRVIGEDIDLVAVPALDLWRVAADRHQIGQVLLNLAVNARDAMPDGGKLTIETSNVILDADYTRQHASVVEGAYVLLAVSDSGIGMSEAVKLHLFEPFFTTKDAGRGTGLGLATCYGIVTQHGGSIEVYSEVGHGTTFKVYLPRAVEIVEGAPPRLDPQPPGRGTETVLLVEDEEAVRRLAARVLRELGYRVLEASGGAEALQLAQAQMEAPLDLLLTDVVLPQMNGRILADRLTELRPRVKVLFMSGYTDSAIVHHGRLDLGVSFLHKPFSPATLARMVRAILEA